MTTTTTQMIHANGIDIHYVEAGSSDAPDLVLLHGGLVSTNPIWDVTPFSYGAHLSALAERFHVIAPDSRGSGRTTLGGSQVSLSLFADDVAELIRTLGLERPVVAGFSMGGMVATIMAIRHPGLARAIVNDAGSDVFDPDSPTYPMTRQIFGGSPDATAPDPAAVEAFFSADPGSRVFFELLQSDHEIGWEAHLQVFWDMGTGWPGYTLDDFAAIDVPVLVLGGDRDDQSPVEDCLRAYRALPHGQLAIVPDTEHLISPEKVRLMTAFLSQ